MHFSLHFCLAWFGMFGFFTSLSVYAFLYEFLQANKTKGWTFVDVACACFSTFVVVVIYLFYPHFCSILFNLVVCWRRITKKPKTKPAGLFFPHLFVQSSFIFSILFYLFNAWHKFLCSHVSQRKPPIWTAYKERYLEDSRANN